MPRSTSLLAITAVASTLALAAGGCQILAGLGGEEPLGGGGTGTGTGTNTGGTTTTETGSAGTGLTGTCTPSQEQSCYSGPEGTETTGACKAGTSTCTEQGMWGACEGEVVPTPESCSAADDENCDGHDCAVWVKTFTGDVYADNVVADAQGNVYTGVDFYAGIDFGDGTPVVPVGSNDVAVLKLDKDGNLIWVKAFNASGSQDIEDIAIDPDGNVVILGESDSVIDFGPGPIPAGVFAAKLTPDGDVMWAAVGAMSSGYPEFVDTDSLGNVYVAGSGQTIDFGKGVLDAGDSSSFWIAKLAGDTGLTLWSKITKGGGNEYVSGIAVDPSNSLVVAGSWNGPYLGLAGAAQTPPNDVYNSSMVQAPLLFRLEPNGTISDYKKLASSPGMLSAGASGMDTDKFGVSTVVGSFTGQVTFQSGTYDTGMDSSFYVLHDQTSGFMQWSKTLLTPGIYTFGSRVAIDGHDNMVILGNYSGSPDLGGGMLPGNKSVFLLKLNSDGDFLWNRAFAFGDGGIQDLAAGTFEDETLLAGTFYSMGDLGLGPISGPKVTFIAKLGK